jgi:death-on-curing protein
VTEAVEFLDVEDLLDLARSLLGDPVPIRDIGLLGSAAARPRTWPFGVDVYTLVADVAASDLAVEEIAGRLRRLVPPS